MSATKPKKRGKITDKERLERYMEKFKKENRPKWALCLDRQVWDHEKLGNCLRCLEVPDAAIRSSRGRKP